MQGMCLQNVSGALSHKVMMLSVVGESQGLQRVGKGINSYHSLLLRLLWQDPRAWQRGLLDSREKIHPGLRNPWLNPTVELFTG